MHLKSCLSTIIVTAALLVALPVFAQHDHASSAKKQPDAKAGRLIPVTEKEAAWATKARATYPLETCVSSDEKLGSMGESPEYIYRVDGKPDRLVVFCCSGCDTDFLQDPAKHLAKIDAAAKAKEQKRANEKTGPKSQP